MREHCDGQRLFDARLLPFPTLSPAKVSKRPTNTLCTTVQVTKIARLKGEKRAKSPNLAEGAGSKCSRGVN